jgi:hypothetical protein
MVRLYCGQPHTSARPAAQAAVAAARAGGGKWEPLRAFAAALGLGAEVVDAAQARFVA